MTFEAQLWQLADSGPGERLVAALEARFADDPEDAEAWLATFALDAHPRLRKESVWQPLVIALSDAGTRVRDPSLAWEVASWLAQLRLRLDCPQNATCELTAFLSRHPSHEEALDELVRLVCDENGDYREAAWAVDDLARRATDPQRRARALVALALMRRAAFPDEPDAARALLAEARTALPSLDDALLRRWAERSRCGKSLDWLLTR